MAEERSTEHFALGLIVAAILFLIFRREFKNTLHGAAAELGGGAGASGRGCGCGGGGGGITGSEFTGVIPIGEQSLSPTGAYEGSSVVSNVTPANKAKPLAAIVPFSS